MKQKDKIKRLEKEIIDLKIQQHTKGYIHIPFSWKRLGLFILVLLSGALAYFNFILLLMTGKVYKVWTLLGSSTLEEEFHHFSQLIILYPLIGEYILIGITFICLTALIKGGFKNIKKYDDGSLMFGLIFGLIAGLIVGLIAGLIFGLIGGLIVGLIFGLIFGLIAGLIVGLIFGLIFGLIRGLIDEFKEVKSK
jgi:hypothetical protein